MTAGVDKVVVETARCQSPIVVDVMVVTEVRAQVFVVVATGAAAVEPAPPPANTTREGSTTQAANPSA